MTSGPHTRTSTGAATSVADHPRRPLRLRLKPKAPPTGHLDGAWWPQSRDLATELPMLAGVLAVRLGYVTRVAYAMDVWNAIPRHIELDGRTVRLEGFRSQDANIVHVCGPDRQRSTLLVIPPDATGTAGHDAMMLASRPSNTDRPDEILTANGVLPAAAIL